MAEIPPLYHELDTGIHIPILQIIYIFDSGLVWRMQLMITKGLIDHYCNLSFKTFRTLTYVSIQTVFSFFVLKCTYTFYKCSLFVYSPLKSVLVCNILFDHVYQQFLIFFFSFIQSFKKLFWVVWSFWISISM